jgi:hypothetical protein
LPAEIEPILRALFGPVKVRNETRDALRAAFLEARAEVIQQARREPAGPTWIDRDDQIAINRLAGPTDSQAAANPVRQQLQTAIHAMAAKLVGPAQRLANTRTWGDLSETAAALRDTVAADPLEMPSQLGAAYAQLLRLGGFLETDIRLQHDPTAADKPLDADIQGLLTVLVRTAAPWLRGFPTVATWDDAAGKALVRAELFQPAGELVRIALALGAISAQDAAEMDLLAEAAEASGYQGRKAANRVVGGAINLILAAAGIVAMSLVRGGGTDSDARLLLVQRAGATLAEAEAQVEAFAATRSSDLRQALRALIKKERQADESQTVHNTGPDVTGRIAEKSFDLGEEDIDRITNLIGEIRGAQLVEISIFDQDKFVTAGHGSRRDAEIVSYVQEHFKIKCPIWYFSVWIDPVVTEPGTVAVHAESMLRDYGITRTYYHYDGVEHFFLFFDASVQNY